MQFDLSRNVDSAATDVLAAINAASPYLPLGIPYPPTIRKVNPADTPILVLGLTSDTLPLTTVDAYAENILVPKISRDLRRRSGRHRRPAEAGDPRSGRSAGAGQSRHRPRRRPQRAGQANVDLPKGTLNSPQQTYTLNTNDQLLKPDAYNNLIVAYRNGAPVRIRDIGKVIEGPENDLLAGWFNNQRAIILAIQRQPAPM